MKKLLIAGAFALLCASPAFAGNNGNGNCQGNCPNTGGSENPTTINNSPTINNDPRVTVSPTIISAPVTTIAPKFDVSPTSIAGAAADASAAALAASKSSSAASSTLTGTVTGSVAATISPNISAPTTVAPSQTVNVDGDNYERAPVSSAFAIGSAGVGEGMCRFGPGVGAQGITAGYNFSLPIFADKLCKSLAKDAGLIRKAALIAQIAGNEAAVQYIASKDAEVSAAITLARTR